MSLANRLFATTKRPAQQVSQRLTPCLIHLTNRSGVTDTQRFREVWHNCDSIDPFYDYKKPTENRLDPTKRAHYYVMWAGIYGTGVIVARNAVNNVVQYLWKPADVLAAGSLEIDLSAIPEGKATVVTWKDSPVFIWHRTAQDIVNAKADDGNPELRDPETDAERVPVPEWYVSMAICTHLGCIPIDHAGNYNGFFCPCHGSHYDASGRIRKGPAPTNMEIPQYKHTDEGTIIIG